MTGQSNFPRPNLYHARTVLAVQPHYDDNDLGAGGTFAALSRAGARLIYLTVTDDQVGVLDAHLPTAETEAALQKEQSEAGSHIGVAEQIRLGYPDGGPIDPAALRDDLILAIRRLKPDFIFSVDPWLPYEFHQDHILTGRAVSEAAGLYHFPRLKVKGSADLGYTPHPLAGIAYYFTHAPNTYFDISAAWQAKHSAVRCYRSQFTAEEMEDQLASLEAQEREAGRERGVERAEALKVLRPAQLHIQTDTWRR
ncbi:MAG TPA: PIG-L deacetylase family protein [Anaerolineaceae bacterium]